MRALTIDELENIYGAAGTLSTVTVIGHPPSPIPITVLPVPAPPIPIPAPSPPSPVAIPPTPPCSSPARAVNNNFIFSHELSPNGGLATTGYYPPGGNGVTFTTNPDGSLSLHNAASGMTIGYGVDLGQMNMTQFNSYMTIQGTYSWPTGIHGNGNPNVLQAYAALTPYLGVRNANSIAQIEAQNGGAPTIASVVASVLSNGALNYITGRAASDYTRATLAGGLDTAANFFGLPGAVQTTLTDITYVFGSITSANPALPAGLVAAVADQNWTSVASLLSNAPSSAWSARLKADGNMLAASIKSGQTPATTTPCK